MKRRRLLALAVMGLLSAAVVVAWRTWANVSPGQFDPVGAVLALIGLAVSMGGVIQGMRSQQDADVAGMAARLAVGIRKTEIKERQQLLGGSDRAIDVQFDFVPVGTHQAAGARRRGSLKEVVDYYQRLQPRRLVITGAGGVW